MIIKTKVEDIFRTYSYFYVNEKDNHAFLTDPGAEGDMLLEIAAKNHITIDGIILTHGHTTDSVCLVGLNDNIAFVGDTIFKGRLGFAGYPGGNSSDLKKSVYEKILTLPDDTMLYSGHSMTTTVAKEKSFRPHSPSN